MRNEALVPYHQATVDWAEKFMGLYINYEPRNNSTHVNALASLAVTLGLPPKGG